MHACSNKFPLANTTEYGTLQTGVVHNKSGTHCLSVSPSKPNGPWWSRTNFALASLLHPLLGCPSLNSLIQAFDILPIFYSSFIKPVPSFSIPSGEARRVSKPGLLHDIRVDFFKTYLSLDDDTWKNYSAKNPFQGIQILTLNSNWRR